MVLEMKASAWLGLGSGLGLGLGLGFELGLGLGLGLRGGCWWFGARAAASASPSDRKLSKVMTHGPPVVAGLLWILGPSSVRVAAYSNIAAIVPVPRLAGRPERTRSLQYESTQPHDTQARAHDLRMKPTLASHSPLLAHRVQSASVCSFRQSASVGEPSAL